MGQTNSREREKLKQKKSRDYRPPESRAKDRFNISDHTNLISAYEASIDKVIYIISIKYTYIF